MVVQTPLYRLCVYRSFAKIGEVYEVPIVVVAVAVPTTMRSDCGLIVVADCGDALLYFVQWCPHTWQHSDVCDGVVSAPTKAQQRETLPRHRGGGRKARTPVGWLYSEMKIS